jgi:hypothetical protein
VIQFAIDEASVDRVEDYLEQTRQNILAGIRIGMREAMEGLSWDVADKLQGSPIVSRTGKLLGAILGSPKVSETADVIRGTVSSDVGQKHIGLWLEEGTSVKAVEGKLFHFTTADGKSVFTHGHKAFKVAPHPFLNPSLAEYKSTIMEIISQKVGEALSGSV